MDKIIFRTENPTNWLIFQLMARGGIRVREVLKLTANDVEERMDWIASMAKGKWNRAGLPLWGGHFSSEPKPVKGTLKERILCSDESFLLLYGHGWGMIPEADSLS